MCKVKYPQVESSFIVQSPTNPNVFKPPTLN